MALQDKIGRQEILDKVCNLIDSLQNDCHFCLSINGAWGSGKTFVLRKIEEQLSKKQEYVIIRYDAWENTFYSDPLIAILSCVIDGVDEKLYFVEQCAQKVKNIAKTAGNTLAKLSSKIAKLKEVVCGIKKIINIFHNPIDMKIADDFKSYKKLLLETREVLNEITQNGEYQDKQTKLIILVDEIDRCLPDEQLKILERLHHLFDIKNCAVIVAMNQECIAKTVQTTYGIDGYEYLRKFFDFSYELKASSEQYLKSLLNDFGNTLSKFITVTNDHSISIEFAYQCLAHNSIISDNRELSRYYDCLNNVCLKFGWDRINPHYLFFIVVALYIKINIYASFLDKKDISNGVHLINSNVSLSNQVIPDTLRDMPYYDYIFNILRVNINQRSFADNINFRFYGKNHFIWCFNEIIYYSMGEQFNFNDMRSYRHQPTVCPTECSELCDLIRMFGGERCGK